MQCSNSKFGLDLWRFDPKFTRGTGLPRVIGNIILCVKYLYVKIIELSIGPQTHIVKHLISDRNKVTVTYLSESMWPILPEYSHCWLEVWCPGTIVWWGLDFLQKNTSGTRHHFLPCRPGNCWFGRSYHAAKLKRSRENVHDFNWHMT